MRNFVLAAAALAVGCARPDLPGMAGLRPTMRFQRLQVERVTFGTIETNLIFAVDNPYPVDIDLRNLEWTLDFADVVAFEGRRGDLLLEAQRVNTIEVPYSLSWTRLVPAVRAVATGAPLPWTLAGSGTFETPVGPIRIPFEGSGAMNVGRRPSS